MSLEIKYSLTGTPQAFAIPLVQLAYEELLKRRKYLQQAIKQAQTELHQATSNSSPLGAH